MPEHEIDMSVPDLPVGKVDVTFSVSADGEAFGRLTVSKGGIGWFPRGPSRERHLRWEEFARLIQERWE
jgi:hypothetical protein